MKESGILGVIGIAFFGTIILICTNGLSFTGLTVFDESLMETFEWSRSTLKFRDFLNLVGAACLMPFVGGLIDRYGVKLILSIGLILLSICFFTYSYIGSATHMYAIHLVMAIALSAAGVLTIIIMVQERVSSNRGLAIGIALAGTSLGGIIMPKVGGVLLETYGWRQAFRYEAIIPLFILALVLLLLKSSDKFSSGEKKTSDLTEVDFRSAIKSGPFWFLSLIGFFTYYSILGTMANLFLYMRELEFTADTAIKALGIMSTIMLIAKFTSGVLTDYINKFTLFRIQIFIMFLGTVLFALYSTDYVWYGIVITGIGWGGLYTLINYIIITAFGVNSAGKIGGTISTFESIGAGSGIWLSGLIADATGNYAMSFKVISVFLFISLLLSFVLKPVKVNAG